MKRRRLLGLGLGATGVALWPELQGIAQQAQDFIEGPPMPDIAPVQVSPHVWVIHAADGFPTPENKGMMSNVTFVTTSAVGQETRIEPAPQSSVALPASAPTSFLMTSWFMPRLAWCSQ